jgi:hypothetical protein
MKSFSRGECLGTIHIDGEAAMNLIPPGAGAAPKYPTVVGKDANAFGVLGKVAAAMDEAGVPQSEVDAFMHAAMAHDHDHLLRTVMNWMVVR